LGFGGVGERVGAAVVAGALDAGDCEGRQEGRSQHKTVSSRSWDSGVEHPRIINGAAISLKNDEKRKNRVSILLIGWLAKIFQVH